MHNFLQFILRHTNLFVFLLLEGLCAVLIVNFNDYHRASFMTSANAMSGTLSSMTSSVSKYFGLSEANEALVRQNLSLMSELEKLKRQMASITDSATRARVDSVGIYDSPSYKFYQAHVINITTTRSRNMITLDGGTENGIKEDMAVINADGVVGLVTSVSNHFALVLPIINTGSHLSVKLKNTNHRGQLIWDGVTYRKATVADVPEHAQVEIGDTIVTSGASSYFPDGLTVGFVSAIEPDRNGGFYNIEVELSVDFNSVYTVELIEDAHKTERENFEKNVGNE